jgi:hypothetical protein
VTAKKHHKNRLKQPMLAALKSQRKREDLMLKPFHILLKVCSNKQQNKAENGTCKNKNRTRREKIYILKHRSTRLRDEAAKSF